MVLACFFPPRCFPRLFTSTVAVAPLCLLLALSRAYAFPVAGGDRSPDTEDMAAMSLTIASPAFDHGGAIPARFTCEGKGVSPALVWDGVPGGAKSLALIVDDPDAPDPAAPKMVWVHWVLYNLPPVAGGLARALAPGALPPGTKEGLNGWKRTGYGGPCPPIGRHRYFFKLYALDTVLPELRHPAKAALERVMKGHILEKAELIGTYRRRAK